jgi:tRNA threonylcarbamoyladenosine modification (KEOPS) complex Cgi121 subunit
MLYASGERQLANAIKKMSVGKDTVNVAVACLSNVGFHAEPGWEEMPESLSSVDIAKLKAFGISDRELGTITTSKVAELVLEKVAAVDILKK